MICLLVSACTSQTVNQPNVLWKAESFTSEAMQAYADEDWNRAQQLFSRSLAVYLSLDDRSQVLLCHINLVEVALAQHNLPLARTHLALADAMVKTEALKDYQARITLLFAMLAMQESRLSEANEFLLALIPVFDGDLVVTPLDEIQLIAIASRTEIAFLQNQQASTWLLRYANALKQAENKNSDLECRLLRFQARMQLKKNDYEQADTLLQQALLMYKNKLSRSGIANTLLEIGDLNDKKGDFSRALNYFSRAKTVFHSLGDDNKVKKVNERLAKVTAERVNSHK